MARIFIAYARKDEFFATKLAGALSDIGANVWIDVEDIPPGMKWHNAIQQGLSSCELMLVIVTPESMASSNVEAEWFDFLEKKKPIIPVLYRYTEIHYRLAPLQYIDFEKKSFEPAFEELHSELLRRGLDVTPLAPADIQPRPEQQKPLPIRQNSRNPIVRWIQNNLVATIVTIILALIIAFLVGEGRFGSLDSNSTPIAQVTELPEATPEITELPSPTDEPTDTPSPTVSPTNTPTLSGTEIENTLQAEMNALLLDELHTQQAQETATAEQERQYQRGTAAAQTLTATLWTATPTIDIRATAEARLTATQLEEINRATATQEALNAIATANAPASATQEQINAIAIATQQARNLTATATLWTFTPSPTHTPTATNTPEPDVAALIAWQNSPKRNADWQPFEQEFDGVPMVLVPPGCFMMGSEDGTDDEQPVHEVCFEDAFWVDKTEVTRAQYQACVESGVCEETSDSDYSTEDNQPINRVNWFQAKTYCEWRDGQLPTEAQWEYAARGTDSLIYPWDDDYVAANVIGRDDPEYGGKSVAPVGSRPAGASWVGALDMSGNVGEWTNSLYEAYPYDESDGREADTGDRTDVWRVLRGGMFNNAANLLRAANRNDFNPDDRNFSYGFRCASSPE